MFYLIKLSEILTQTHTLAMVNLAKEMQVSVNGLWHDLRTQYKEAMKEVRELAMKKEFESVIDETQQLLKQNDEWVDRYATYAEKITNNMDFIKKIRQSFREWSPLKVYINTTSALNAKKTVNFELRYLGQTVARLSGKEDGRHKLSTKGFEKTNLRDFDCDIKLLVANWDGKEAAEFRIFLKKEIASVIIPLIIAAMKSTGWKVCFNYNFYLSSSL